MIITGTESNQPIVHASITDMVADKLRDRIRDGTFKTNQKLIEAELCKIMEVSRTPIRKAFNILVEEGFLERIRGYGVVVAGNENGRNYYFEIFTALERAALEKAVIHISYADLADLKKIQLELEAMWMGKDKLKEFGPDEWKAFSKMDIKFHDSIVRASGNPLISEYIELFCQKGNITEYTKKLTQKSIFEHRNIIKAIEEKNADLADQILKNHFDPVL